MYLSNKYQSTQEYLGNEQCTFFQYYFSKKKYLTIINQTFFLPNNLQDRFLSIFQPVLQYSQLNRSMKNWGQFFEIARILEIEIFEWNVWMKYLNIKTS